VLILAYGFEEYIFLLKCDNGHIWAHYILC